MFSKVLSLSFVTSKVHNCGRVLLFQVFNMFRKDGPYRETIERLVLSPRLAKVASELLGCKR